MPAGRKTRLLVLVLVATYDQNAAINRLKIRGLLVYLDYLQYSALRLKTHTDWSPRNVYPRGKGRVYLPVFLRYESLSQEDGLSKMTPELEQDDSGARNTMELKHSGERAGRFPPTVFEETSTSAYS